MTSRDLFRESFSVATANRLRTFLTVLGIVIGIASVISMIAIGAGTRDKISQDIQSIGSNLLFVIPAIPKTASQPAQPGMGRSLTKDDAQAIKMQIPSVDAVAIESSGQLRISAQGKGVLAMVSGTSANYNLVRNVTIDQGSYFFNQDVDDFSRVAIIGSTVRDNLLGKDAKAIGSIVRIGYVPFRVIGVTKTKGGAGTVVQDNVVYIPISTAEMFLHSGHYISMASVKISANNDTKVVQSNIDRLLLGRHGIANSDLADFQTINQSDIMAAASSVSGTMTTFLGLIAGISLVVGGIGIMNMMFTGVTERTREIGLRKAVGARPRDIYLQFLTEATLLTTTGGLIGIVLGWLMSMMVSLFSSIPTQVTLSSIALSLGVSFVVGIIFGFYPAKKASDLHPVDALRYE